MKLPNTNPYSQRIWANREIPCSRHAACTSSVMTHILSEWNFFWVMENPIPGHVIEMQRVKVLKFPYFSRFVRNNGAPYTRHIRSNEAIFLVIRNSSIRNASLRFPSRDFTVCEVSKPYMALKFHGTWSFQALYCIEIPWHLKFPSFILHWNFTAREVSKHFIALEFHGTWSFQASYYM